MTAAFSSISAETKIITKTLVDEDFSKATQALANYTTYSSLRPWQPMGTSNIVAGVMFMAQPGAPAQYGYFDFGYGYSNVEDNWVMEFDIEMPNITYAKGQVAVTGENSSVTSCAYINDVYLAFTAKYSEQDKENLAYEDELRRHTIIVGGEELDESILIRSLLHVKMECAKANTSSAELTITLNCADFSNYVIKKTVDAQAIGKPRGFYCYSPQIPGPMPKQFIFDNIKLTTQSSEEYEKCAVPTFTVTGVSGKSRTVAIACATEGAEIYYSSTPLNIGDEGWIKYDGEITSEYKTLYAYAVNAVFEDTTEVVSFDTGAGSQPRFRPQIIKLGYEPGKGYRFTIDPNLESIGVLPQEYTWLYSVNGESGEQMNYNLGDTLYVTEGNTVWTQMEATGYTIGRATWATEPYPNLNTVWEEDFIGKIAASGAGTEQMSLTLSDDVAFVDSDKDFRSITKVGNTDISIDSRVTLTTDSVFYMQRLDGNNGGLLSLKSNVVEVVSESDDLSESEYEAINTENNRRYDGIGIQGLTGGQYVFVRTNGVKPELRSMTAELVSGVSTKYEYVYHMYSDDNLYLYLPYGTYVKSVEVQSNKEMVTTNEYGYATYITNNALDFSEMPDAFVAKVVIDEPTSNNFTWDEVIDAPAGEVLLIKGEPNTTYSMPMISSADTLTNLLTYSATATDISNVEKPVYVVDLMTGNMEKVSDKTQPIPAFTPYIISALDETVFRHYTMSASGRLSIYSEKALDISAVDGLKAYALEYENPEGVHLKEITKVPAGNGAILEGTAGAPYDVPEIPVATITCDNKFKGSETSEFVTADTDKAVYALNTLTGDVEVVDKSVVTKISAGEAYYVSKYSGFEELRTNAAGATTHVSSHALDFTEAGIQGFIATSEVNPDSVVLSPVGMVPAGTAFLVKKAKANYTYKVPYYDGEVTIGTNLFRGSLTEEFDVSTVDCYVYGLLENSDVLKHVDPTAHIPERTAYIVSQYKLPVHVDAVDITIPSSGMRSFVTSRALDFTGMESLEVLVCDTVTLKEPCFKRVYEVPANTAFFVKGVADTTYTVPVGTCESLPYNNLIQSNPIGYYTGLVSTYVYIVSDEGEVVVAPNNTSIPAGEAYIISPWRGYEDIKIAASGNATWVTKQPLDFTILEGELTAMVVDNEKYNSIHTAEVTRVPAGTALVLSGTPNAVYSVPVGPNVELNRKNLLRGSAYESFAVSGTDSIVYVVSGGKFVRAAKTLVIPAGKAYLVSKYRGFEEVTTSESGHASYVCEHDLDLTDLYDELEAYIANYESPSGINLVRVVQLPAGAPFFMKGKANTTYKLPYANVPVSYEGGSIMRGSRTEDFDVASVGDSVVYCLSGGEILKVSPSVTIPAGKAYIVSKYLGFESITTAASGYASYVCEHALDVTDYYGEVQILVADYETESPYSCHLRSVKQVPAGTAFFFKTMELKDSTYKIPYGDCTSLECENLIRGSRTEPFDCSTAGDSIVYALMNGELTKVAKTVTIPAGKGYIVSEYGSSSAGAKRTFFIDDEYITAIDDVQEDGTTKRPSRRVNLAGQEVDDSYKGIVIDESGKKYLQR